MQGNGIDLLFPSRAIDNLRNLRSERWEKLVSNLVDLPPTSPDRIAFVLLMVRINGCASCQSDSFRAMRGCIMCSSTMIKRYKGDDQTLIDLYNEAKKDVVKYMNEE
jgi:nitrate reductase cytochrome c-type subunit